VGRKMQKIESLFADFSGCWFIFLFAAEIFFLEEVEGNILKNGIIRREKNIKAY
jgi:hypothetical protein